MFCVARVLTGEMTNAMYVQNTATSARTRVVCLPGHAARVSVRGKVIQMNIIVTIANECCAIAALIGMSIRVGLYVTAVHE